MAKLKIYSRAFHSQESFGRSGAYFKGDNRPFSTDEGATSRVWYRNIIDLTIPSNDPFLKSDPSKHPWFGEEKYTDKRKQPVETTNFSATPYRKDGDQSFELYSHCEGQNFDFPGSNTSLGIETFKIFVPAVKVTTIIHAHIDRTKHKMNVTCTLNGRGFPDHEVFMIDGQKNALFLCSHIRTGTATSQLAGSAEIKVGTCALEVDWNEDDTFGDQVKCFKCLDFSFDNSPVDLKALMSGNPTSIADWNKVHTSRNTATAERKALDNAPRFFYRDRGSPADSPSDERGPTVLEQWRESPFME